jgi:hypothetical protein
LRRGDYGAPVCRAAVNAGSRMASGSVSRLKKTGGLFSQTAGNQTQFRSAPGLTPGAFRQIQEGLFVFDMRKKTRGNTE